MEKYRIKIETEKSGKKWYTTQAYQGWFFGWDYIDEYGTFSFGYHRFSDIADAENRINIRRKYLDKLDAETIIHVEYKAI